MFETQCQFIVTTSSWGLLESPPHKNGDDLEMVYEIGFYCHMWVKACYCRILLGNQDPLTNYFRVPKGTRVLTHTHHIRYDEDRLGLWPFPVQVFQMMWPMNGWMDEWMNERTNEWMNEWMNECMNAWMHECMNAWMHKCINAWINT